MRKIILFIFAAVIGIVSVSADTFTYKDTQGLYYLCDDVAREAVLVACQDAEEGYVYTQDAIVIPSTLTINNSSIGDEGSSQEDRIYKVIEIGENALKDSWAFTITFSENSNIRVIRRRGLYGIGCSGTFELPASLKAIEEEGLYVKSSAKAKQYISELVLPEGLESLAVSSIVLNRLQTLRFLGTVPPVCATADDATAYNPWTATVATPADVELTVPEGSMDAYYYQAGIGDYFTAFTGYVPQTTPTGIVEVQSLPTDCPRKMSIRGQVLVVSDGHKYNILGTRIE